MKPRIRKAFALACLAIAFPFGGVAAFQLYCMFTGVYDPVVHDQMRPENVAGHITWLIGIIVVTFLTSLIAGWYVHRTSPRA